MKITIKFDGNASECTLCTELRDANLAAFNGVPVFIGNHWKVSGPHTVRTIDGKIIIIPGNKDDRSITSVTIKQPEGSNDQQEGGNDQRLQYSPNCIDGKSIEIKIEEADLGTSFVLAILCAISRQNGEYVSALSLNLHPYGKYQGCVLSQKPSDKNVAAN